MDGSEFVGLSGRIVSMGRAGARSAVSRAYYGAFHIAMRLLDELDRAPPRSGKAHNLVPQMLESAGHPDGRAAGTLLSDLHSDRS